MFSTHPILTNYISNGLFVSKQICPINKQIFLFEFLFYAHNPCYALRFYLGPFQSTLKDSNGSGADMDVTDDRLSANVINLPDLEKGDNEVENDSGTEMQSPAPVTPEVAREIGKALGSIRPGFR